MGGHVACQPWNQIPVRKFDLALSYDYRVTFTDKVDVVENRLSEYDNYGFLRLGLNYTLGKKNKPMEWINPMEVVYNDIGDLKDKVDILSGDKDKDGVSDMFDKDNSTAEGLKVMVTELLLIPMVMEYPTIKMAIRIASAMQKLMLTV